MIVDDVFKYLDSIGVSLSDENEKWYSIIINAYPFLDESDIEYLISDIVNSSAGYSETLELNYHETILSHMCSFASIIQKCIGHEIE